MRLLGLGLLVCGLLTMTAMGRTTAGTKTITVQANAPAAPKSVNSPTALTWSFEAFPKGNYNTGRSNATHRIVVQKGVDPPGGAFTPDATPKCYPYDKNINLYIEAYGAPNSAVDTSWDCRGDSITYGYLRRVGNGNAAVRAQLYCDTGIFTTTWTMVDEKTAALP